MIAFYSPLGYYKNDDFQCPPYNFPGIENFTLHKIHLLESKLAKILSYIESSGKNYTKRAAEGQIVGRQSGNSAQRSRYLIYCAGSNGMVDIDLRRLFFRSLFEATWSKYTAIVLRILDLAPGQYEVSLSPWIKVTTSDYFGHRFP